jgi:serine/threonine protein kinase/predicted Zn-dependent protease
VDSERWLRIKELFIAASEQEESEQHLFLEQACAGNKALADEVEALLQFSKHPDDSLQSLPSQLVDDLLRHNDDSDGSDESGSPGAMAGKVLGRYRIIEKIGSGGMGVVYKAEDTELGRYVVLKFFSEAASAANSRGDHAQGSMQRLDLFRREARAASALDHPNICIVHDVDQHEGVPFIVMQFLSGQTLKQLIGGKPLATNQSLDLAIQIADALGAAHKAGIIHRDIKSANIFVTERGEVKILDFGLARLGASLATGRHTSEFPQQVPARVSSDTLSIPGTAFGTVAYMSPEQVRGDELGPRSDLYSLGVVLFEMATGILPFQGNTVAEVLDNVLHQTPVVPSSLNSSLPRPLERLICKTIEKAADLRYQSANELRDDLKRLQSRYSSRRRPLPKAFVVAFLFLVLGAGAVFIQFRGQKSPALTEQDTLVLGDFINKTGETVFDGTLKQALRVKLEQSPFLKIVSDQKTQQTLSLMGRPSDTALIGEVAREACVRVGGKAFIDGSISALGSHYIVGLRALNCQTGEAVANEQGEAENREIVLRTLDSSATKLRTRLGESLASIQKYDTPLDQVTTSSLDALHAFSMGMASRVKEGDAGVIYYMKRAIELDPNFAAAYEGLGVAYLNSYQPSLGVVALKKAYDLRERVSEREKLGIESIYYDFATGQADEAIKSYQLYHEDFPREAVPCVNLAGIYSRMGQHQLAINELLEALHLGALSPQLYLNLSLTYINLDQLDKAEWALNEAKAHNMEGIDFAGVRYEMAFLRGDHAEMKRQVAAVTGQPVLESWLSALDADSEAYVGRLGDARRLTHRAINSARHNGDEETALSYAAIGALREAEFGNRNLARAQAAAIFTKGHGQDLQVLAALALAQAGENGKALALVRDLKRSSPLDTLVNDYWIPTFQAIIETRRNHPRQAIEVLEPLRRYDFAAPPLPTNVVLYPVYVRGSAYLAAGEPEQAEAEFQKIIDHRGLIGNYMLGALADLGLGRAYAMKAGIPIVPTTMATAKHPHLEPAAHSKAVAKAQSAYQVFFTIWKDADVNTPLFIQARSEYHKLR